MSHSTFVSPEECGERLDTLLAKRFPSFSRTYFQYLIEEGAVLLNGERAKKRVKPSSGDEMEICFILTPEISLEAENIPLNILYEDEHLLIVNKPAGMVVHPAPGHHSGTFVNALLHHCKELKKDGSLRPGIVHRLDKDTSGILVAAKTAQTHAALISLFSKRLIKKEYLAVCIGNPGEGIIEAPIGRHPTRRKEMAVCFEKGKEAITKCKVIGHTPKLSLVQIELITGRTHQIRVHMKYRSTPVLGDLVYGAPSANKTFGVHRQLLHAHKISFCHPILNKEISITAPLSEEMENFIQERLK